MPDNLNTDSKGKEPTPLALSMIMAWRLTNDKELLRQQSLDTRLLDHKVNLSLVKGGDIKQLSAMA